MLNAGWSAGFTVPLKPENESVGADGTTTVNASCLVAAAPALSAARTVKVQFEHACAGAPLRTPAALKVRPAGGEPAETVQV